MNRHAGKLLLGVTVTLIVLATVLAYAHALPTRMLAIPGFDKVLHFTLFGMLTLSLLLTWGDRRYTLAGLRIPLVVVLPLFFAAIEEGLQGLSPYRQMDIWDLACDAAGMLTFWWVAHRWPIVRAKAAGPTNRVSTEPPAP